MDNTVSIGSFSIMPIVKELDKNNKIDQILIITTTKSSTLILSKFKQKLS